MLKGERVTLRALNRDDLPLLWASNNDLEVELAGGGDPPKPQSFEQLRAAFDQEAAKGSRGDGHFAIEYDRRFAGHRGIFAFDDTARTCELG